MQFQLLNTESFSRIGAELSPHGLPGNYQKALYSTDYLERFVRSQTMSGHHPVGTCKMGSHRDLTAVVDNELKFVQHCTSSVTSCTSSLSAPCGLRGCRNRPLCLLAGCHTSK